MAIDTKTPNSPGWWLTILAKQLQDRNIGRSNGQLWNTTTAESLTTRPGLNLLEQYYQGNPPLRGVADAWRATFANLVRLGRLNVAELLIAAKGSKLDLRDFRTAAADDELGDAQARKIMKANKLKLVARDVHENFLAYGDSYVIVTPPDDDHEHSLITSEVPQQVITAHDPATGRILAGLKLFHDDVEGADIAYVYLPGEVWKAVKSGGTSLGPRPFRMVSGKWEWDHSADTPYETVPGNRMAVVRFRNKRGVGEFEQHLDTLDRINDQILGQLVIQKTQAFRQRAVEGLPDRDPVTRELIDYRDKLSADVGVLWRIPAGAKFWESTPVDIGPIRLAIKDDIQNLAAATSTSLPAMTPDAASGSAQGASLMREQANYSAEDRRDRADASWPEVLSLAFEFAKDADRADVGQIVPIWGPIERYTLTEKASATAQVKGVLPLERIYTDIWQYPPAEIPDMLKQIGHDFLRGVNETAQSAVVPTV